MCNREIKKINQGELKMNSEKEKMKADLEMVIEIGECLQWVRRKLDQMSNQEARQKLGKIKKLIKEN